VVVFVLDLGSNLDFHPHFRQYDLASSSGFAFGSVEAQAFYQ